VGSDQHRTQVVAATRTRGHAAVVGHVVDLHDQLDIEHELCGAQRANQPQSGCDGPPPSTPVEGPGDDEATTSTTTTNPYPTTTPTNAGHI
jgi:hypothetical protein